MISLSVSELADIALSSESHPIIPTSSSSSLLPSLLPSLLLRCVCVCARVCVCACVCCMCMCSSFTSSCVTPSSVLECESEGKTILADTSLTDISVNGLCEYMVLLCVCVWWYCCCCCCCCPCCCGVLLLCLCVVCVVREVCMFVCVCVFVCVFVFVCMSVCDVAVGSVANISLMASHICPRSERFTACAAY